MSNIRIAARVKPVKDPSGNEVLKATLPVNVIFERNFDAKLLERTLSELESEYLALVDSLKGIINSIRSNKQRKDRVFLYWELGDKVHAFSAKNQDSTVFLDDLTRSLIRDAGLSEKMLARCKRFRVLYPDRGGVDRDRSFDSYVATFEGGYVSKRRRKERNREPER